MTNDNIATLEELRAGFAKELRTREGMSRIEGNYRRQAALIEKVRARLNAIDAALSLLAEREKLREPLQPGRDHLTVTGKFQSDKYPWCAAGFVPLKTTDPMARDLLSTYAERRAAIDKEFCRDLTDALFWSVDKTDDISASVAGATDLPQSMTTRAIPDGWKLVPIEPTEPMLTAACRALRIVSPQAIMDAMLGPDGTLCAMKMRYRYAAMLSAAPQPPERRRG